MHALLIGYARVSTYEQDLTAQRVALERLGADPAYIFTDHGLTGTNRARPGLREALAGCRDGDTLVVAKLDRLARSLRDAKDIVDELTAKHVKLSIGGSVHDPLDPVGRLLFNVLAMVAVRVRSGSLSAPAGRRRDSSRSAADGSGLSVRTRGELEDWDSAIGLLEVVPELRLLRRDGAVRFAPLVECKMISFGPQ